MRNASMELEERETLPSGFLAREHFTLPRFMNEYH